MKYLYFFVVLFIVITTVHAKNKIGNSIKSKNNYVNILSEPENLTPLKKRKILKQFANLTIDFKPTGTKKVSKSAGKAKAGSPISGHIIGGSDAVRGQFPWQAAMILDRAYLCGGSLITKNHILTAAHCAKNIKSFAIKLGAQNRIATENGVVSITSNKSFIHPNYDSSYIRNDVAIVLLPNEVVLNSFINLIRLPKVSDASNPFTGTQALVSGWGRTSDGGQVSAVLKYVSVPVISNEVCLSIFGSNYVVSSTLCTSGAKTVGTCNGDSGGPLVYKEADGLWTQIGIVSFGPVKCVDINPSAYARVTSFLGWISDTTKLAVRN